MFSLILSHSLSLSLKVGKYTTTAEGIEAEPHPLWEYPAYPRSEVVELMTFDLTVGVPEKAVLKNEGEISLNDGGSVYNNIPALMLLVFNHTVQGFCIHFNSFIVLAEL